MQVSYAVYQAVEYQHNHYMISWMLNEELHNIRPYDDCVSIIVTNVVQFRDKSQVRLSLVTILWWIRSEEEEGVTGVEQMIMSASSETVLVLCQMTGKY